MRTFETTAGRLAINLNTIVSVQERGNGQCQLGLSDGTCRVGVLVPNFPQLVLDIERATKGADEARAAASDKITVEATGMNGEATLNVGPKLEEFEELFERFFPARKGKI